MWEKKAGKMQLLRGPAMRERSSKIEPPQFLSGWKEIANYLGKGVRTVQRYERQLGLPVRRPAGKPWGSVVATRAELDGWVSASPIRNAFQLSTNDSEREYAALSKDIRRGLEQMALLRDQMFELRSEVRQSIEKLQNSVYELQGELNANSWRELGGQNLVDRDESELLALPGRYPKAS
jgi:hypothetical protein